MNVRATFNVKGKVQDVGLRAKTVRAARSLGLAGRAENLQYGTMTVVCEGPRSAILELRKRMKAENGTSRVLLGRIRYGKARSPSHGFRKVPERDFQKSTSRKLDEGVRHLGRINLRLGRIESGITGLDRGIKGVDGGIKGLDRGIKGVDRGIKGLDRGIKGVDRGIKGLDRGIKGVDRGIKTMDRHMGGHFRRLDRKYDRFGATMAKVARDLHGIRGDLRKAVSGGKTSR